MLIRRRVVSMLLLAALCPGVLGAESIVPWPESEHDWRVEFSGVTGSNIPPQGRILQYQADLPGTIHVRVSLHPDLLDRVLPYIPGNPAPFEPANASTLPLPKTGHPDWWTSNADGLMWTQARGRDGGMLTLITLPDPDTGDGLILQMHWQGL